MRPIKLTPERYHQSRDIILMAATTAIRGETPMDRTSKPYHQALQDMFTRGYGGVIHRCSRNLETCECIGAHRNRNCLCFALHATVHDITPSLEMRRLTPYTLLQEVMKRLCSP